MRRAINAVRKRLDAIAPEGHSGCSACVGPPLVEVAEGDDEPDMPRCLNPGNCPPVRRIVVVHCSRTEGAREPWSG